MRSEDDAWHQFSREFTIPNDFAGDFRIVINTRNADAYIDDVQVIEKNTIALTSPTTHVLLQRNDLNTADIAITGTYTGNPVAVEARFNNGNWVVIDDAPVNGTFSGTLLAQTAGQGAVDVRFSNDPATLASVDTIAIGDLYVIAGQNNAEGHGNAAQQYQHDTLVPVVYTENDVWKIANDPIDINTNRGSYWPLVASSLMGEQNIPIGFISTARGGTALVKDRPHWQKGNANYNNMIAQIQEATAGTGNVKAILWLSGLRDVRFETGAAEYTAALGQFITDIRTDLNQPALNLVAAQLTTRGAVGDVRDERLRNAIDAVRKGQQDAWAHPAILQGPVFYDIGGLSGQNLMVSQAHLDTAAARWAASLSAHFYNGADGQGPQLERAEYNAARDTVTVIFTDASLPLQGQLTPARFRITDDNGLVPIVGRAIINDRISLTFEADRVLVGDATITLGSGNDLGTITDSSAAALPADTFYNVPIQQEALPVPVAPEPEEENNEAEAAPSTSTGPSYGGGPAPAPYVAPAEETNADDAENTDSTDGQVEDDASTQSPSATGGSQTSADLASHVDLNGTGGGDMEPATRCTLPTGYVYEDIKTGMLYYITPSCHKRTFQNISVYQSYKGYVDVPFLTTSDILETIPYHAIRFMPWGPEFQPQDGDYIKVVHDPKIYLILGGKRYWIADEDSFMAISGNWKDVNDVDQTVLEQYEYAGVIG